MCQHCDKILEYGVEQDRAPLSLRAQINMRRQRILSIYYGSTGHVSGKTQHLL